MKVRLKVLRGPMAGRERIVDPEATAGGRIVLGREPGIDGWILDGDPTVSRRHGELFVQGGDLVFANLGGHGTVIDRVHTLGQTVLRPGATVQIGSHAIELSFEARTAPTPAGESGAPRPFRRGLLAKPWVRAVLGAYLLGLLVLVVVLGSGEALETEYRDSRQAYATTYLPTRSLTEREIRRRLASADRLAAELAAQIQAQRWRHAEHVCHRMMALDRDPGSPLFEFAARRLGDLQGRGRR